MKIAVLLGALLITSAPAWAANKCVIDGKTVYQQAPCPGGGPTVGEDMKRREAEKDAAQEARRRQLEVQLKPMADAEQARQDRLKAAGITCPDAPLAPAVGMSEVMFRECSFLGRNPDRINETETAAGITRQYVFGGGRSVRYVYTRKGVITAIQR